MVGDSSPTFNVSILKKVLVRRDGAGQYIETASRRGYGFITDVREVSGEDPNDAR